MGTSKNPQFLGRPFPARLERWAERPEHRVRESKCLPGLCSWPSLLPSLGHWLSSRGDEEEKPLEVIHQVL